MNIFEMQQRAKDALLNKVEPAPVEHPVDPEHAADLALAAQQSAAFAAAAASTPRRRRAKKAD